MFFRQTKVTKKSIIAIVLIYVCCFDLLKTEWASVGKSHSFVCAFTNKNFESISWLDPNTNSIYYCSKLTIPKCDPANNFANTTYEANMTFNDPSYTSIFTIKNVTIFDHNSSWPCQAALNNGNFHDSIQHKLYAFAPAQNPTCDNVTVFEVNKVKIHCFTENVFPEAICDFYVNTTNTDPITNGSVSYTNQPSEITGYNKSECTFIMSAATLGRGSHRFYVVMHPNISSNITLDIKRTSQYAITIKIDSPRAAFALDCDVLIKDNENGTCTCVDSNPSFFLTQVKWSAGNKTVGTNGILIFNISSLEAEYYICTITSILNVTDHLNFFPKAYHDVPKKNSETTVIAIGAGVCAGIILTIAVLIIGFLLHKKGACLFKNKSNIIYEKLVDNSELYYRNEKLALNFEKHQDYKNIISSIQSASEPPKNISKIDAPAENYFERLTINTDHTHKYENK